jgi:hypothetical protein
MPVPDQCALDASGNLKDAKDIEFYFSESERMPLSATLPQQQCQQSDHDAGNSGKSNVLS